MIRWNQPLAALAVAALALAGCSGSQEVPTAPQSEFDAPAVAAPTGMAFSLMPASATPSETSYPLVAGQSEVVGSVYLSNDTEYLYVRYAIDDPGAWCIAEMHFAVASSYETIPQANGNPIPGQFPYSHYAEPDCLGEYAFPPIPLHEDWGAGDDLHVAAHAVVAMPVAECTETVWQIGDVEEPETYPDGSGPLLTNYADEFNWSACDPAPTPYSAGANLSQCTPDFVNPFFVGSTPDADFPYNANFVRDYATDLDVVWTGALWFGGSLKLSWSPGQSAAEQKVVSDGVVIGTFNATGTAETGMGWFLDRYPLVENSATIGPKAYGDHTLNFTHTRGDGTFWDWIRLEKPCIETETAWAGVPGEDSEGRNEYGFDFPGKNWATYVQYEVQGFCPLATESDGFVGIAPPWSVAPGASENAKAQLFEEGVHTVPAGVSVDEGAIPEAGGLVCTYYLHVDALGSNLTTVVGYVEFEEDILALAYTGSTAGTNTEPACQGVFHLYGTDGPFGHPDTVYPDFATANHRGLECGDQDAVEFQDPNALTVSFDLGVAEATDGIRVFLPVLP